MPHHLRSLPHPRPPQTYVPAMLSSVLLSALSALAIVVQPRSLAFVSVLLR
jgi:hypothetical protein